MRGLKGKVGIVAGAGPRSSIGAGAAFRLAEEGVSVVLGDINIEGAQALAKEIEQKGGRALAVRTDLGDEASVANLVGEAVKAFGGLDILFANAADTRVRERDTDVLTVPLDVFDQTIAVGVRGHLLCARHAIPEMLKRGGGALIFTSSDAAAIGMGHYPAYMIAKAGVNALMRHVAFRWGKEGIRANCVSPGLIQTETVDRGHTAESKANILAAVRSARLGLPDDIAGMVAMLASDDGVWINGQVFSVNGGQLMRN